MSNVLVTKRDGSIEEFQVEKVRRCINWACTGLQVEPLVLESKFSEYLQDEVSSSAIQKTLIHCARTLASALEPDWIYVAGRLLTMERWADTGGYSKPFYDVLTDGVISYAIEETVLNKYTRAEIDELGEFIDPTYDLTHSYGSVLSAIRKYLMPGENIQHMFMVDAMMVASVEKKEDRVAWAKAFYIASAKRKISWATPWLGNLRSGGNVSSCFIIKVGDSIKSIFANVTRAAETSKAGGGLGISLAEVRAMRSEVAGRPESSKGVFGWAKIFNDVALAVDQGGKRAGAFTIEVPIWHRDIEGFLEIQNETGDPRTRCFDIFPQVSTYDLFWELDEKDAASPWHTFCPYEVKKVLGISLNDVYGKEFKKAYSKAVKAYEKGLLTNVKVYPVRDLIKKIMSSQFGSGLPYIAFMDAINEDNPNDHEGTIPCVNLCNESFSVVKTDEYAHTCNLISVVAGRCDDLQDVQAMAALATRALDNGIALTTNPMEIGKAHNERYRTIGVGIQGLHDWLAKNFLTYANTKDIGIFAEHVQYGCVEASIQLAKERGAFPAFEGSRWQTGKQITKYAKNSVAGLDWNRFQPLIDQYGIRNSQLTSPAPNTTSSVFMDAGPGVMPCYGGFYIKDNDVGIFPVAGMYLKENPLCYAKNASKYEHKVLVDAVAQIQKFVDAGISSEYIFDHNRPDFSAKSLYDLITYAWKKRTKAVYYIRHIKKGKSYDDAIGISTVACEGCAD